MKICPKFDFFATFACISSALGKPSFALDEAFLIFVLLRARVATLRYDEGAALNLDAGYLPLQALLAAVVRPVDE